MRRPVRFRLECLESRVNPVRVSALAANVLGDFSLPHTTTEIMASIRSNDPIGELSRMTARDARGAELIDPGASHVIFTLDGNSLVEVRLAENTSPEAAARWLAKQSRVAWTEPNQIFVGDPLDFVPNDPQYGQQYHLPKMQLPTAWDITTGDPSIVVAITDDGIAYNHPDLAANIWNNEDEIPGNGVDDDGNGFIDDIRGWDFNANDNDPNPGGSNDHGTHVMGIAAAVTNNATGVAGVAGGNGTAGSGVRIMPIRWYNGSTWTAAMIANSYAYAADNGAKITSASYAFDQWASNTTVIAAFDYSYGLGVLHTNSAGNNNQNNPARSVFTQALMVGSLDSNDVKSSFSNYGTFTDISAPGSNVLATTTSTSGTVFSYGLKSGTSMSTPNAAGVAALIWSKNPTWTREQVVAQLLATADNIDAQNPGFVGWLGSGRANAGRALTETIPAPKIGVLTGLPAAGGLTETAPTSITIQQVMRLDPATVAASSFELRGDGPDNTFNTADDVLVPLTMTAGTPYRVGTNTLTMTIGTMPLDKYRFIGKSSALRNPFGTALDGNGDGTAGDDFIREFTLGKQISGLAFEDWNADGVRDPSDPALAGVTIYHDANDNGTFDATPPTTVNSTNVPLPLPDLTIVNSITPVSGFVGTITDVNVTLTINHLSCAHLDVFLISPSGTRVELFTDVGGTGDNFINTTLDQQAAIAITSGSAPFSGTYRPEGNLNTLNGQNPNGNWTLEIRDDTSGTTGTLTAWSVRITSGEASAVSDSAGTFGFSGFPTGTHTFRRFGPAGTTPTGPDSFVANLPTAGSTAVFDVGQIRSEPAVYGRVYDDANSNGSPDPGEAGQPGRTVFVDVDNNGQLNGEPQTTTDALGNYRFPLAAGSHNIRLVPIAGMVGTNPANNLHTINVTTGPVTGRDFGQVASSIPTGAVTIGAGTARSRIEDITVTFSEIVTFTNDDPLAAFSLTRTGFGPVLLNADVIAIGGQTIVTLSFLSDTEFGSLVDGRYVLNVDHTRVQDLQANQLQPMAPTNFHRYFGDYTGDGQVDGPDFSAFSSTYTLLAGQEGFLSDFDFNDDGQVDGVDFSPFSARYNTVLP